MAVKAGQLKERASKILFLSKRQDANPERAMCCLSKTEQPPEELEW